MKIQAVVKSFIVSVLLSFPAVIFISFAPNYTKPLLVPNISIEKYKAMSTKEQQDFLAGEDSLRKVVGIEKIKYLLTATPETYAFKSILMFLTLFLSGIFSVAFACRNVQT